MSSRPDPELPVAAAEADDDEADELLPLPAGAGNYMTPAGFRRLDEELRQLSRVERPKVVEVVAWAAGNGDRSENGDYIYGKRRLREIDRRIRFLRKRLEIAKVVDPAQQKVRDRVFFGATVTYADARGAETTVRIVGIDEGRPRARAGQLGVADRPGAPAGAGRRQRAGPHARRAGDDRGGRDILRRRAQLRRPPHPAATPGAR